MVAARKQQGNFKVGRNHAKAGEGQGGKQAGQLKAGCARIKRNEIFVLDVQAGRARNGLFGLKHGNRLAGTGNVVGLKTQGYGPAPGELELVAFFQRPKVAPHRHGRDAQSLGQFTRVYCSPVFDEAGHFSAAFGWQHGGSCV